MVDAAGSSAPPGSAFGVAVRRLLLLAGLLLGMLLLGAVFADHAHADTGGGHPPGGHTPPAHAASHKATRVGTSQKAIQAASSRKATQVAARSVSTAAPVSSHRSTHASTSASTPRSRHASGSVGTTGSANTARSGSTTSARPVTFHPRVRTAARPVTRSAMTPVGSERVAAGRSGPAAQTAESVRRLAEPLSGSGGALATPPSVGVVARLVRPSAAAAPVPAAVSAAPAVLHDVGLPPIRPTVLPSTSMVTGLAAATGAERVLPTGLIDGALEAPLTVSISPSGVSAAVSPTQEPVLSLALSTGGALATALPVGPLSVGVSVAAAPVRTAVLPAAALLRASTGPPRAAPAVSPMVPAATAPVTASAPMSPNAVTGGQAPVAMEPGLVSVAPQHEVSTIPVAGLHGAPELLISPSDPATQALPDAPVPPATPPATGSAAASSAADGWAPLALSPELAAALLAAAGLVLAGARRRATWWFPEIAVGPG